MTIILTFCSHTILQKSAMVLCKGPCVQMKSLSDDPPWRQMHSHWAMQVQKTVITQCYRYIYVNITESVSSYGHKICVDVVTVWLWVLNGQPHSTVVIYVGQKMEIRQMRVSHMLWLQQTGDALICLHSHGKMKGYLFFSLLTPVFPALVGRSLPTSLRSFTQPKTWALNNQYIWSEGQFVNMPVTSNSCLKPKLSLAASDWQWTWNSCRICALEKVWTLSNITHAHACTQTHIQLNQFDMCSGKIDKCGHFRRFYK